MRSNFLIRKVENEEEQIRTKKKKLLIVVKIYLVRNSVIGWAQRIGEKSPLAIRWISGWISSYVTTGTLFLNVSGSIHPFIPCRFKYSVSAFRLKIWAKTFLCTSSHWLVTSSINCNAVRSFSLFAIVSTKNGGGWKNGKMRSVEWIIILQF